MKQFPKKLFLLTMILFLQAGTGYSDTVMLRNGDRLIGDIQNEFFVVRGPYSQLSVNKAFCKNIIMEESQASIGSVQTINNDIFIGAILTRDIQIFLTNQTRATVKVADLKSLFIDTFGPSHEVTTTIFTTANGSRFSGKLLNPEIRVRNGYMTAAYQTDAINRIEFRTDGPDQVSILLSNGDFIQGNLLLQELTIQPDSAAQVSVQPSEFSSIQFNAAKMLLKEFSNSTSSQKDSDGDGVSDAVDGCPNTSRGDPVDERGCSTSKLTAKEGGRSEKMNTAAHDNGRDSVADQGDQDQRTPVGIKSDKNGYLQIGNILFDFDSNRLKPQYAPVLDEPAVVLQRKPLVKIEIQGGRDNIGSEDYNRVLSHQRAQSAKNYLVKKGIEPGRIKAVGYGIARNIASNENAAGRALNRRVDLMVVE